MDLKSKLGDLYTPELETKLNELQLIPKSRLDEVIKQREDYKTELEQKDSQLKQYESDLQTLKDSAKDLPELKEKISKMQEEKEQLAKELDSKLLETNRTFELHKRLMADQVNDEDARNILIGKLNDVQFKDGKLVGYDDVVNPLKESPTFKNWFGKETLQGNEHQTGDGEQAKMITYEQFKQMTPAEREKNIDQITQDSKQWSK